MEVIILWRINLERFDYSEKFCGISWKYIPSYTSRSNG
jgi:hypothetical protein